MRPLIELPVLICRLDVPNGAFRRRRAWPERRPVHASHLRGARTARTPDDLRLRDGSCPKNDRRLASAAKLEFPATDAVDNIGDGRITPLLQIMFLE